MTFSSLPMPAVVMGTQLLGAPRYPALRGIMQARSKPVDSWKLGRPGHRPRIGRHRRSDNEDARLDQAAGARRSDVRARVGGRRGLADRRLPGFAEAHLMAEFWAIGELVNGAATKLTLELATLARQLAEASGGQAKALLVGEGASAAGSDVAKYVASVLAVDIDESLNDRPAAAVVAPRVAALVAQRTPDFLLVGASRRRQ